MNSQQSILDSQPILIGSTFPLSLIRCLVSIAPATVEELRMELSQPVASSGDTPTPSRRPTSCSAATSRRKAPEDKLPSLDGQRFDECWVLSPEYKPGYRPGIGEEVPEGMG